MKSKPTFRNEYNQRYTRQLFFEQVRELPQSLQLIDPPYTLVEERPGKICFRKVYVELGDPTGYKIANLYLEDYQHWNLLMKSQWFREAKRIWDEELDAKLAADGMESIKAISDGFEGVPPAVQLSAAKFLATKGYKEKPEGGSGRGRPSKEEVKGNLKQESEDAKAIQDDFDRISKLKGDIN